MESVNLTERKRQLVRDELSAAALKAFALQGFDETTIDEITRAVGVSRRTFFRYFKSKEDVIIEFLAEIGARVPAELAARPVSELPAVALRQALATIIDTYTEYPQKSLALAKLILSTPALRARYLDRQYEWRTSLARELAHRTGLDLDNDLRPTLIVSVALAAFDTSLHNWVRSDGQKDLHQLVDQAFTLADGAMHLE